MIKEIGCATIIITVFLFGLFVGACSPFIPKSPEESIILSVYNSHEYKRGVYDCNDFTRDAVMVLKDQGYDAHYMAGYNKEGGHAWVRIYTDYDVTAGLQRVNVSKYDYVTEYEEWRYL